MTAMSADLKRGGTAALSAASTEASQTVTCAASVVSIAGLISNCE
jgi:hypothetical protein